MYCRQVHCFQLSPCEFHDPLPTANAQLAAANARLAAAVAQLPTAVDYFRRNTLPTVFGCVSFSLIAIYLDLEELYHWMRTCRNHFQDCYLTWTKLRKLSPCALRFTPEIKKFHPQLEALVDYFWNEELRIPKTVQYLTFSEVFDRELEQDYLPKGLLHLRFGAFFNKPLQHLPSSLKVLILGDKFNEITTTWPNLSTLEFGCYFNKYVKHLPINLKKLTFGWCFNHMITTWPPSLTSLEFGNNFNQPVVDLPSTLKRLIFGKWFNKPLDLPNQLEYLVLGEKFQQPLMLPPSLIQLTLHPSYPYPVPFANYDFKVGVRRARFTMDNIMDSWTKHKRPKKESFSPKKLK